jgi:hypothetical protein
MMKRDDAPQRREHVTDDLWMPQTALSHFGGDGL